jgi:hypothetical protein
MEDLGDEKLSSRNPKCLYIPSVASVDVLQPLSPELSYADIHVINKLHS